MKTVNWFLIPDPWSLDKRLKNLLILDDCYLGKQSTSRAYFTRERHSNCDVFYKIIYPSLEISFVKILTLSFYSHKIQRVSNIFIVIILLISPSLNSVCCVLKKSATITSAHPPQTRVSKWSTEISWYVIWVKGKLKKN